MTATQANESDVSMTGGHRRPPVVVPAMLLASMWFQFEVQGQESRLETTVTTTFAAVEPEEVEVRKALLMARVSTLPDQGLSGELEIVDVRWVAATPGGFAVVDPASSMVGFFDESGEWLGHAGAPGEGPGEFSRRISQAVSFRDRLWVPDTRNRRLNVIDISSRTWLDSRHLDLLAGFPVAWLSPGNGELVAVLWGYGSQSRNWSVRRWTGDGLEASFSWVDEESRHGWGARILVVEAADEGTVALLDRQAGVVTVYDLGGNPLGRYAFDDDAVVALSEDDRAYLNRLREPMLARAAENVARRLSALPAQVPRDVRGELAREATESRSRQPSHFKDRYPFFLDVRFDPESETIWVARPLTASEMRDLPVQLDWVVLANSSRYWDAYAFDGSFRYRLEVPLGFIATDARDGRFYGYQVDALGLRHAVVLSVP